MLVAKLTVSYGMCTKFNGAEDIVEDNNSAVKVLEVGAETKDGKVIRGLGTHFESKAAYELSKKRFNESMRIRTAFKSRFMTTPIDSLFIVPSKEAAQQYLDSLEPLNDVKTHLMVFNLTNVGGSSLDDTAMSEWAERVKNQFKAVKLGRGKDTDEEGLKSLETLAKCPVISSDTRNRILDMVGSVRLKKMDKDEFRRKIDTITVKLDSDALSPRRAPTFDGSVAA